MDKIEDEKTPKFTAARILFRFIQITDTRCRENLRQRVSIEHKKHVHVSFILNNGKPSPRRALASCSSWWSIQKKTLSTVLSKKDV